MKKITFNPLYLFLPTLIISCALGLPNITQAQNEPIPTAKPSFLEQVRENRKSLIRDRLYESESVPETSVISKEEAVAIDQKIAQISKQVVIVELKNSIVQTQKYIDYLSGISDRVEIRLAISDKNSTTTASLLSEARSNIALASTTISGTASSSNLILDLEEPAEYIASLKADILNSVTALRAARLNLKSVIELIKS